VSTIAAIVVLLRVARLRDLAPALLLVATQALWFSLPKAAIFTEVGTGIDPLNPDFHALNFTWVALGHAVQYLWVTSYYARSEPGFGSTRRYLGKTLVAGTALWTLPLVVFAWPPLGGLTGDGGFYLLMASCINIHHFVLDGAIWKLRDSRIAGVLLRDSAEVQTQSVAPRRRLRRGVWAVATIGTLLAFVQFSFETRLLYAHALGDLSLRATALDGLAWFGRDSARDRRRIAKEYLDDDDPRGAAEALRRSLDLEPDLAGYSELAYIEADLGDHTAALAALDAGLEIDPDRLGLLHRAGEACLALGRPGLAIPYLERGLAVDPNHRPSRHALRRARGQAAADTTRP
jgi:tetratricopeptide (TPR) repeat protein